MSAENASREQLAWNEFCMSKGWACRLCGEIPEIGKQFNDNLCEDCQLSLRNYGSTSS